MKKIPALMFSSIFLTEETYNGRNEEMGNRPSKMPLSCKFLIFLQLFLGIGAIFGGGALVLGPSGNLLKMPLSFLEHSPFTNYFIPGIILLIVLGVIPTIVAFALIKKWEFNAANKFNIFKEKHWSWSYSLYIGFALIIWINVQEYLINAVGIIHLVYIAIGLSIQITSLLPSVQKYYELGE